MRKKQSFKLNATATNEGYQCKQISNVIRRYQEIRDAIEITSARYERLGGNGAKNGKEELLCTLIDIDQAVSHLSPRQRVVIQMLENGYLYEDICRMLGVSINTVRFHVRQGIFRLTTYLNAR